jgi:trans-2,3-dihydro-3-hydroxyanthranilate isomerase
MEYLLFDVFAEQPFAGNQLAVFPDAGGLDAQTMQRLAKELNIAESIFLTRTGNDRAPARVRIFTPALEVAFAGHPTIGATIAIADVLRWVPQTVTEFVLKEQVGDVAVSVERNGDTRAWLRTPRVTLKEQFSRAQGAAALSLPEDRVRADLPVQLGSAGNPFLYVPLVDVDSVDAAVLDQRAAHPLVEDDAAIGLFVFALTPKGTYARMFAPMSGIAEDPATGSATGPLYAYLLAHGALPKRSAEYTSEQGVKMGRRSVLHVRLGVSGDALEFVDVGGQAIHIGGGTILDEACYHDRVMFNRDAQQQQGLITT